jgi:hypothetical protein
MLEVPVRLQVPSLTNSYKVKILQIWIISREVVVDPSEAICSTPYGMMIWSALPVRAGEPDGTETIWIQIKENQNEKYLHCER